MIKYSSILAESYAKRCGADYHMITSNPIKHMFPEKYNPSLTKVQLFLDNKWMDKYDQILYLDTDAYVWPTFSENIFDITDDNAFNVVTYKPSEIILNKALDYVANGNYIDIDVDRDIDKNKFKSYIFNAGVIIINRYIYNKVKKIVRSFDHPLPYRGDQRLLHYICFSKRNNVKMHKLPGNYNVKASGKHLNKGTIKNHYITHVWGKRKFGEKYMRRLEDYAKPFVESVMLNYSDFHKNL